MFSAAQNGPNRDRPGGHFAPAVKVPAVGNFSTAGTAQGTAGAPPTTTPQTPKDQSDQHQPAKNQSPLPTVSLPKGGGAIRDIGEKFSVNPSTGTASITIPIPTSENRSQFGPNLVLSYNSGSGNGPFGLGWSMQLDSITRKTDKGLPRYRDEDESDTFIFSGAEDLVPVLEHLPTGRWARVAYTRHYCGLDYEVVPYKPRVENAFARIERWVQEATGDTHWRTISKDNITSFYGEDNHSRVFDPSEHTAHPTHIYSWLLSRRFDDKGNVIKYEYKAENSQGIDLSKPSELNRTEQSRSAARYIKRIKYGNYTSFLLESDLSVMQWMFEVVFDYGDHDPLTPTVAECQPWRVRPDPFSTYRPTFEVRLYRLCRRILMFHNFPDEEIGADCLVSSLDIAFRPGITDSQIEDDEIASFLMSITRRGYVRQTDGSDGTSLRYLTDAYPPIEFEYAPAVVSHKVHEIDPSALKNLPGGIDDAVYRWLDLDGEGISGILTKERGSYYYKHNMGNGHFGSANPLDLMPSLSSGKNEQWMDLSGDGHHDLVQFEGHAPGFYKRTSHDEWLRFKSFESLPNIDKWKSQNLQFIDLTGDGLADVLIANDEIFTWYPSIGEVGFGPAEYWRSPLLDNDGPRLLFQDPTISIYVADMTGDGLSDLVRIRNGQVCYWPNIGYGRFGSMVIMGNSPWFDYPELFKQSRIRLADIDGSGPTDLIYLGSDGTMLYRNQSGNSWTRSHLLHSFPQLSNNAHIHAIDLLGRGTTCLVWSSDRPSDSGRQLRYVDLMSGNKPHLLVSMKNNLGTETRIQYTASTEFYLADKLAGKPWATRLAFPVQVVERMETFDFVSRNLFVTRYAYHHGFFDGVEREFRGFGMVEQWDTEEFAALNESTAFPHPANIDAASHVPPMHTKTWYHTGVYFEEKEVSRVFKGEYYREPNLSTKEYEAMLLEDTIFPHTIRLADDRRILYDLSVEERREACRALKGSVLREEIYAVDGTHAETMPYKVTESNFTIEMLQPQAMNRYATYFKHERESIDFHYERKLYHIDGRKLADPRVVHDIILDVDYYGNVLCSTSAAYGRRHMGPCDILSAQDYVLQKAIQLMYTHNSYTNGVFTPESHRIPLIATSSTYQLFHVLPRDNVPCITNLFRIQDLRKIIKAVSSGDYDLPFQDFRGLTATEEHPYRRLIKAHRTVYRRDDLDGPLPPGRLESLALLYEVYQQAFDSTLSRLYIDAGKLSEPNISEIMDNSGGYVEINKGWWIPTGKVFYSPNTSDSPAEEATFARRHFFLPRRYRDPFYIEKFDTEHFLEFDRYDLLVQETRDALGNRTTVGERNSNPQLLSKHGHDYRVLKPVLVMDSNRNRTALAYDILGLLVGSALMGKPEESLGDSLEPFNPYLSAEAISSHFENPLSDLHHLLGNATSRYIYDYSAFYLRSTATVMSTLTREIHVSDLQLNEETRVMLDFSYFDSFQGRIIQHKRFAGHGPVEAKYSDQNESRYVCTGWKIFDNKGNAVREYEPFYTPSHSFEFDVRIGVSPTHFYDPVNRLVSTLFADQTWSKFIFDPWSQEEWDGSDTVLQSPSEDPEVGDFFRRLLKSEDFISWYFIRIEGGLGREQKQAAQKASVFAQTPKRTYFDALAHPFLSIEQNTRQLEETGEFYRTFTQFDIDGNVREIVDAKSRKVAAFDVDMMGSEIHQASMEAGEHWQLNDVLGMNIFKWDNRGQQVRSVYDELRRVIECYLRIDGSPEILVERADYGESLANAADHNNRERILQIHDQAGVSTTDRYDFKGNLLRSQRQFSVDYKSYLDWSMEVVLESTVYTTTTMYDALNRTQSGTYPDQSVTRYSYNQWGQLRSITTSLQGSSVVTPVVSEIGYNARAQRLFVRYGNQVKSSFEYDPLTFRISRILTRRNRQKFPDDCPQTPPKGWSGCQIQDLRYTYDAVGNITEIRDAAQQSIFFRNKRVNPTSEYTYDAIYRLIEASGREHLGQIDGQLAPLPSTPFDGGNTRVDQAGDGNAMGRYRETYTYDVTSNILAIRHERSDERHSGWTRSFHYEERSQLEANQINNRLSATAIGNVREQYYYDSPAGILGNMTAMPQLSSMQWDYKNRLQVTAQQAVANRRVPETTYYVYDSKGSRVRKVIERYAVDRETSRLKERMYLGEFEIYRKFDTGGDVIYERQTLQIVDDRDRVALIETQTQAPRLGRLFRYQFADHLRSVKLELDEHAQVISYEEYTPYGSTSYQAVRSEREAPKRYRFGAKEYDKENGLYYYGRRYYACWICRWTSCDPIGLKDGMNLYEFVRSNPVNHIDPTGTETAAHTHHHRTPHPPSRPSWQRFKAAYPDYSTESATVKQRIGGSVNTSDVGNTCAVRMSRGLNYSGVPLPPNFPGLTKRGADGKRYALRVADMRIWLPKALGKPDFDIKKPSGQKFDKSALAKMKGIIVFDIPTFSNATGHLDIWDGRHFSSESQPDHPGSVPHAQYWEDATRITVWNLDARPHHHRVHGPSGPHHHPVRRSSPPNSPPIQAPAPPLQAPSSPVGSPHTAPSTPVNPPNASLSTPVSPPVLQSTTQRAWSAPDRDLYQAVGV